MYIHMPASVLHRRNNSKRPDSKSAELGAETTPIREHFTRIRQSTYDNMNMREQPHVICGTINHIISLRYTYIIITLHEP